MLHNICFLGGSGIQDGNKLLLSIFPFGAVFLKSGRQKQINTAAGIVVNIHCGHRNSVAFDKSWVWPWKLGAGCRLGPLGVF